MKLLIKKKIMNILVRADSSSLVGTGHVMRDLVLAKQYKNDNIIFATQDLPGNINYKIKEASFSISILKSPNIRELSQLIKKLSIDLLVIDNYNIDYNYEKQLKKENKKLKILSFDDTYEKHYCDILLNHNISANKKKYKKLVPKNCEVKCGSQYTLLREEFIKEKKKLLKNKNKNKNKNKSVFVAMGGTDHSNINIKILKVLESLKKENHNNIKNLKINLVTTTANANLEELINYIKNKKWINLCINSNKVAKLMRKSDFAVVTPSVTLNEIYYMNVPFIAIQTAANQKDIYKYLKKEKYNTLKEYTSNKFYNKFKLLMASI